MRQSLASKYLTLFYLPFQKLFFSYDFSQSTIIQRKPSIILVLFAHRSDISKKKRKKKIGLFPKSKCVSQSLYKLDYRYRQIAKQTSLPKKPSYLWKISGLHHQWCSVNFRKPRVYIYINGTVALEASSSGIGNGAPRDRKFRERASLSPPPAPAPAPTSASFSRLKREQRYTKSEECSGLSKRRDASRIMRGLTAFRKQEYKTFTHWCGGWARLCWCLTAPRLCWCTRGWRF